MDRLTEFGFSVLGSSIEYNGLSFPFLPNFENGVECNFVNACSRKQKKICIVSKRIIFPQKLLSKSSD